MMTIAIFNFLWDMRGMGHNLRTRKAKKGKDEDEEKCDTCGAVAKETRKPQQALKCPSRC